MLPSVQLLERSKQKVGALVLVILGDELGVEILVALQSDPTLLAIVILEIGRRREESASRSQTCLRLLKMLLTFNNFSYASSNSWRVL